LKPRTLPMPPLVSQLQTVLPDGTIDPASLTDCGESCMGSALAGLTGVLLSPGCIRQAMGLPSTSGNSNASQLAAVAHLARGEIVVSFHTGDALWKSLGYLRKHGRYALILGHWLSPDYGHWVLAYERDGSAVRVMGPWGNAYARYSPQHLESLSMGSQVWLF
jgi:hypothetical protein